MLFLLTMFLASLILLLLLGVWGYNRFLLRRRPGAADGGAGLPPEPAVSGPGWWAAFDMRRLIGVLLALGGLWHAAAPWIFGYEDVPAAVASNVISGLALTAVGIAFAALKGGSWLSGVGAAIGVWVLFAPPVLGFHHRPFALHEAIWGGPLVLVLIAISLVDRWLSEGEGPPVGRPTPAGP